MTDFLTEPRARHDVDTSLAAAESMRCCSGPMQRQILALAIRRGAEGVTYDEVVIHLTMEKPTAAGRINDLVRGGFLSDSGRRRRARSGRSARVYLATEIGRRAHGL